MPRRLRALVAVAIVTLAGCAEEPRSEQKQQDGVLVIRESLPEMPRYIEGSLSFLRVERVGNGEVVVDGPVTDGMRVRGREPLLSSAVAPGEYRLVSYQRPCNGNCEFLDPPTDRCEASLRVNGGDTLTATVLLGQDGGCTVSEQSQPTPQPREEVTAAHRKNSRWAHEHLPRMYEARARAAAEARGLDLRVVRLDGRGLLLTADRISTRVNVEIRSGTVSRVVGLY